MPRPLLGAFGVLAGLFTLILGGALVARADSASGVVGASLFLFIGVMLLLAAVAVFAQSRRRRHPPAQVVLDGEPATFYRRPGGLVWVAGLLELAILGLWALAMAVAGAVDGQWFWPVVLSLPAAWLLGFGVFAAIGRLRPGGLWITPTRVVNDQAGVRSELPLAAVGEVRLKSGLVVVAPSVPDALRVDRLPRPWSGRRGSAELTIDPTGLAVGATELAARLQRPG